MRKGKSETLMSGDGMSSFVAALTNSSTGLTGDTLWGVVTDLVPVIVGVATFAVGFYLVRKLIKGMAKGKLKM